MDIDKIPVDEAIRLNESLQADKLTLSDYHQDIVDYVLPKKSNVNQRAHVGQRRGATRYDSTGVHALELLSAAMKGNITSSAFQWFKMMLAEEELYEIQEIAEWLQECDKLMYSAINASNFNTEDSAGYLDLGGFGTAAMETMEKPRNEYGEFGGLAFRSYPVDEYTFLDNDEGIADTICRVFKLTPYAAMQKWPGMDLGKHVNEALHSDVADKKYIEEHRYLHIIYPRFTTADRRIDVGMPFGSRYIQIEGRHEISRGGFHELPVAISRWAKATDDKGWGRGPGMTALPDIMSLNEMRKGGLIAAAKDNSPPLVASHKGIVGNIRTNPNGITYIKKDGKLEYLVSGNRGDKAQISQADLRQQIREVFFADQLEMQDASKAPNMTATEAQLRYDIMQRLLGPTLGRIERERLSPIVFRVFNIMLRAGVFPPVPDALRASQTQPTLKVEYIGPMARAQKMQEVIAIERTVQHTANMAEASQDPSIWDNLDLDEATRTSLGIIGAPVSMLRDEKSVSGIRKARQEAQQQANDMAEAQDAADIQATQAQAAP